MARKKTTIRKRGNVGIEQWKLDFLLSGEEPEEPQEQGINPFEVIVFCGADPNDPPCRHGAVEPWFRAWEKVKDDPYIEQWREKHGKAYAESLLEGPEAS